jgi:hypothetical protein
MKPELKFGGRRSSNAREATPARVARGVEVYLLQRMSATTMSVRVLERLGGD